MTLYSFKNLLTSTACALVFSMAPSVGMDQEPETKFPYGTINKKTWNFDDETLKLIDSIRVEYHQKGGKADKLCNPLLLSHAHHLLAVMKKHEDKNCYIPVLIKEVMENIENNKVSPIWHHFTHLRFLALLSNSEMGKTEKELFEHTPSDPEHYNIFFKMDEFGKPLLLDYNKFLEALYKTDNKENSVPRYRHSALTKDDFKLLKSELSKLIDYPLLYPFLEKDIFHPRFILNCWFNNIFLVGMPTQKVENVHGEEATSLGFAFHDWFHQKINTLLNDLHFYCQIEYVEAKFKNPQFDISKFISLAFQKYTLILDVLKYVNQSTTKNYTAFTGLFFLQHEYPSFSHELFTLSEPSTILETMLKGSLAKFDRYDSWENPEDLFDTNPFTGKSALTPKEIIQVFQERVYAKDDFHICPQSIFNYEEIEAESIVIKQVTDENQKMALRKKWFEENFTSIGVDLNSTQFIDITVSFKNNEKQKNGFPTLKRKVNNFGAVEGMLSFAKQPALVKPETTSDHEQDRLNAIDFIKRVNEQVQGTMTNLVAEAKTYFGEGTNSFTHAFKNQFTDINSQIEMLKKSPEVREMEKGIFEMDQTISALDAEIKELQKAIENAQEETIQNAQEVLNAEMRKHNEEFIIASINETQEKLTVSEMKMKVDEIQKMSEERSIKIAIMRAECVKKYEFLAEIIQKRTDLLVTSLQQKMSENLKFISHINSFQNIDASKAEGLNDINK